MLTMRLTKSLIPALALTAVIAAPGESEACDPGVCHNISVVDALTPVNAAQIPSDGVLVLRAAGMFLGAGWSDAVTLEVSLGGQPVSGAIEPVPEIGDALLWRPAAALAPGVYAVTGAVDNDGDADYCGDDLELDFEFTVDAAPSTTLIPPEVAASEQVTQAPNLTLAALVCCAGVAPTQYIDSCGESGPPDFPEGSCGVAQGLGTLSVTLDVAPKLPIATVGMLAYTLIVDGEAQGSRLTPQLKHDSQAPLCTQVKITNLATGEAVTSDEICHGADVVDMIGPQELDPTGELTCDGPLQTCEADLPGESWDLKKCTPWLPESETGAPTEGGSDASAGESGSSGDAGQEPGREQGCACSGDADDDELAHGLGLLALLALRRRRGASRRCAARPV